METLLNAEIKLRVAGLSKKYESKTVLDNVSFEVKGGEFLSVLGPSGCGKTTLLRILAGLLEPSDGRIYLNERDITNLPSHVRHMGIVFQNYALFENMTVLKNVEYALKIKKDTRENSREKALAIIEKLGLSEHINKKPHKLSGGQQQRVAIARTLVLNPEIILFDEPMSSLDVTTRYSLRTVIKDIQKEFGTTLIYITHDQEEAFDMSDRIMVMKEANTVQIGTPEEIIKSPSNDYIKSFVIDNLRTKIDSMTRYMKG